MTASNYQLMSIPSGAPGTKATLKIMSKLVNQWKAAPQIRELALQITKKAPNKNWKAEAAAVHNFILKNIRYVKDVRGIETIQTPVKTLQLRAGDCDDHSTLAASLLESIGHPTRFVAAGYHGKPFSHVYCETLIGNKWLPIETTEKLPPFEKIARPTRVMIQNN